MLIVKEKTRSALHGHKQRFHQALGTKTYASSEDDFACLVDHQLVDHLEGSFSFKEVQFKMFYPAVETSCPRPLKTLINPP